MNSSTTAAIGSQQARNLMCAQRTRKLIHIGLPRAGSTSLQQNLLPRHPQIVQCGDHLTFNHKVFRTSAAEWETTKATMAAHIRDCVTRSESSGQTLVWSSEGFCQFRTAPKDGPGGERVSVRLKQLIPDGEILFIVRNQRTWFRSAFLYSLTNVLRGGALHEHPLEPAAFFSGLMNDTLEIPHFPARCLRLYDIYTDYVEVFGEERVHVLPFEFLSRQPDEYARRLGTLLGCATEDVDKLLINAPRKKLNINQGEVRFWTMMNHVWPRRFWPDIRWREKILIPMARRLDDRPVDEETILLPEVIDDIDRVAAPQNRQLQKYVDFSLEDLGYPLKDPGNRRKIPQMRQPKPEHR